MTTSQPAAMRRYFGFFFISGLCSLLYELVWLRLAMAEFAVTAAFVSIVLSTFMAGLGVGSWGAGRWVRNNGSRLRFPPLLLYAATELLIGLSAIAVPYELSWGRALLERLENSLSPSVPAYYVASGAWIAVTLVPWCACMGATFPFAMFAIREDFRDQASRSFSYLYLANVCGAVAGCLAPLFLVEELGFKGTLHVGAVLNLGLGACAAALTLGRSRAAGTAAATRNASAPAPAGSESGRLLGLLFATGLTSMGAEVVWSRLFTPALGTFVYAFAIILVLYLAATYYGSRVYRRGKIGEAWTASLPALLGLSVLVPLASCDPRLSIPPIVCVVAGVFPFSALAGFLTPMIMDRVSGGDPDRAGRAYAINIAGCVLGPLLSGFVLLPLVGERISLCLFALPWLVFGLLSQLSAPAAGTPERRWSLKRAPWSAAMASVALIFLTRDYADQFRPREVLRDHTATVVATGTDRAEKRLLINGVGITSLTPITKMMAHMPLAFLGRRPQNALVICFGMGTTHRAMLSWGIHSTAVELVPSVPSVFSYFHSDGAQLLQSPLSRVVIDDGRFYLERSNERYDVIVIDPPPPVQAAASSLLYSKEFYAAAKRRLQPDGIVQQWLPHGDTAVRASVAKALKESFPYVRVFPSVEGWGLHFLASSSPIPSLTASVLAGRLPPAAAADLIEWGPASTAEQQFAIVLGQEIPLDSLIRDDLLVAAEVVIEPVGFGYNRGLVPVPGGAAEVGVVADLLR